MSIAAVSVAATATVLIAKNSKRAGLIIDNQSAQTVFIGDGSGVTAATGITLPAGEKFIQMPETNATGKDPYYYFGAYYGIVASGTADCRVLELITDR